MIRKNIIFLSLIFFLTNCGFTPVYLNNTNVNFSVEQVNYTGDRELNNFLKTNLTYLILLVFLMIIIIFYILTSKNTNLQEPWINILNIKKYPKPILGFKDNVLSKKECKELINLAKIKCEPSIVGFNNKFN